MIRKFYGFALIAAFAATGVSAQSDESRATSPLARTFSYTISNSDGYLGVQSAEITKDNFAQYGLSAVRGVAVKEVVEGSPAQQAGLQTGDVIIAINGDSITGTRKLTRLISEIAPDHTARVTVFRNGSEREINVTVGKRPMPTLDASAFPMNFPRIEALPGALFKTEGDGGLSTIFRGVSGRRIGIGVTTLTTQLSQHYKVDGGVMVNQVSENAPAEKAGLRAGDIITEADGKKIASENDLINAIRTKTEGSVTFTIVRNGAKQQISVTPENTGNGSEMFLEQLKRQQDGTAPSAPRNTLPARVLTMPGRII